MSGETRPVAFGETRVIPQLHCLDGWRVRRCSAVTQDDGCSKGAVRERASGGRRGHADEDEGREGGGGCAGDAARRPDFEK